MKYKHLLFQVVFFACTHNLYAQSDEAFKTTIELSQGYRRDRLDIKTREGRARGRKFQATDKFKHIDTYISRLEATVCKNDYYVKASASYGDVYDGKLYRSFHLNSNWQSARSINSRKHVSHDYSASIKLTGDYTADFSIALGKKFTLKNGWNIAPKIGYGVYLQNFHTKRGPRNVRSGCSVREYFYHSNAKEKYKATWYSPLLGLQIQKTLTETLRAHLEYTFLFPLSFQGKAQLSTRHFTDKQEEQNKALKSFGNIGILGLSWNFATNWTLKPEFELMKFYSKGGDAANFYRFKHANRTATEYRIALCYTF